MAINVLVDFDDWAARHAVLAPISAAAMTQATRLVREFSLGILFPDALHVAICGDASARLLTTDRRQAVAARHAGINISEVD